jgi:predicted metal-dependent hydrolase
MKNIAEKAYDELFSMNVFSNEERENRHLIVKYNGKIKGYNANAKYNNASITFTLSRKMENVDEDIQIGLIQSLMIKIYKNKTSNIRKIKTDKMEMYETFIKGLSKYAKKQNYDPILEQSFLRVNETMFNNEMEKPNLIFASESFRKLGSYEYGTDTIHISSIFQELEENEIKFLDYVIYHELLHKKHLFETKNGRHHAHTKIFKEDEAKFAKNIEEELNKFLRKKKYSMKKIGRFSIKSFLKFW